MAFEVVNGFRFYEKGVYSSDTCGNTPLVSPTNDYQALDSQEKKKKMSTEIFKTLFCYKFRLFDNFYLIYGMLFFVTYHILLASQMLVVVLICSKLSSSFPCILHVHFGN